VLLGVLDNHPGAAREIVALNAGTALYTANVVDSIGEGIVKAREVLASGAARAKLEAFVACTRKFA
jgi:anthranilate phosphoribosyltransferase